MTEVITEYYGKLLKPNPQQVNKIRRQLEDLHGLSTNKKIDYVFDGINRWEDAYNIATITLAFDPDCGLLIDGIEYPDARAMYRMKKKLQRFRESTLCRKLVLYPSRGANGKGEWRYFNMQNCGDWEIIQKMDVSIVNGIKRWIRIITTLLSEDPKYRNESHKKEKSEIRYELMLRRRILRRLKKKKAKQVNVSKDGEQNSNETDEK